MTVREMGGRVVEKNLLLVGGARQAVETFFWKGLLLHHVHYGVTEDFKPEKQSDLPFENLPLIRVEIRD